MAKIDDKTTFIDFALPGEEVMFQYTRKKSSFDEGVAIEVLRESSERVIPCCEYFTICGGCSLQHLHSAAQIRHKQAVLLEQLAHFAKLVPEEVLDPLTGNPQGYRRKARWGVR